MSCPDCFKGAEHDGKPIGTEDTIHGVFTYVAEPKSGTDATSTIILITDAFGFNLVNSKLLADIYAAKTGCRVLVPDIIPGGGVPVDSLQLMERVSSPVGMFDLLGQATRAYNLALMLSRFVPFAIRTRNVFPAVLAYARAVRSELPHGAKLGAAGFCWGALQTTKLSQESAVAGEDAHLLDAHFMAHPSGFGSPEDIVEASKRFQVPVSIAVGDKDMMLSVEAANTIQAGLKDVFEHNQSLSEVVIYAELADSFARAGFLTVLPDLFNGDPAPHDITFDAADFLSRHNVNTTDPIVETTINYIRNKLKVKHIAVTGYCFGGRYAFRFLAKGRGADVGFAAHPSLLQDDEVLAIDNPASIAAAETDSLFQPARRLAVEGLLAQTAQPFQINLYSGTSHGFGVRANVSDPEQKFGKEEAFWQAVRWFNAWSKA
ncbi:hypothetical protein ACHAQA_003265 [Verticillium albo-atrum]